MIVVWKISGIIRADFWKYLFDHTVRTTRAGGIFRDQGLCYNKVTFCYLSWNVNEGFSELFVELSFPLTLVWWKNVFSWVTHVVDWMVVTSSRDSSAWLIESLRGGRVPYFRSWTFVFSCVVLSRSIEFILELVGSWSWIDSNCRLLELVVKRSSFWIVDWSHGPLRSLVVSVFIVPSGSRELYSVKFDIASGSGFLSV